MTPKKTVFVTKPYLPPLEEMLPYIKKIWDRRILSNSGPFHRDFEQALCDYLGVNHISVFCNGTVSLVTALRALKVSGEVITTPFSFVATSHALLWNNVSPVFVDIEEKSLNISPAAIEEAITEKTSAILPVHCYGHPCKVNEIQKIANKYNLKVIYDAAHAFGVECEFGSVLSAGDLSSLSFHATKVFNTFEGGAVVCPNEETKHYLDQLKNFGHEGEDSVLSTGINGKMSEFNAALGILQLDKIDEVIAGRRKVDELYRDRLREVDGIYCLEATEERISNYSYFPILVKPEYPVSRDVLCEELKAIGVHPRKYFHPLISDFPMYRDLPSANPSNLPVASEVAKQILCLPIYHDLEIGTIEMITNHISSKANTSS